MQIALNQHVFQYLNRKGYRYCLSKTIVINTGPLQVCIVLKPSYCKTYKQPSQTPVTVFKKVMQDALAYTDDNGEIVVVVQLQRREITRYLCSKSNERAN